MIKVQINRGLSGNLIGLNIIGHADYAEYGSDIVCAGVSALAETCVLGIEKVAGIDPILIKKEGYFRIQLPAKLNQKSQDIAYVILETVCLGIKDIAKSYPDYIKIESKKEVL
jgi:uncharacterized protein YsxB (DUF464 family)